MKAELGFFEKFLSIWVILCIAAGIALGQLVPEFTAFMKSLEIANVSIPIAVLIWLMIYPMMLKIDFTSILQSATKPKGIIITVITNWLIKPITMYLLAFLFFKIVFARFISPELAGEYLAGAVLLGAAPCTAMVFVWSYLTKGHGGYTLVQVAINDLIILFAYAPIVAFLLGVGKIAVPLNTLFYSVLLFVVIPFTAGFLTRILVVKSKGKDYYNNRFINNFRHITPAGLLLTLVIIFSFQGDIIISNPLHIMLISVPLILQTFLIFGIAYLWALLWKLPHNIASPAAMIGASNFFELAVAVAIALFGLQSGATLATVVGVLVEVPVMLFLVRISNKTKTYFTAQLLEEEGIA